MKNFALDFLFNKNAGLGSAYLLKETTAEKFSCEFCEILNRAPLLQSNSGELLLNFEHIQLLVQYVDN